MMKKHLLEIVIVMLVSINVFSCKKESTTIATTGVTLNQARISLNVGNTDTLKALVIPSNASNNKVNWRSSDTTIATVNFSGIVTGVKAGSSNIIVTTADGNKTDTCIVTVMMKWTTYTTVDGLANNYVTAIAIDLQGNKWFGTWGGGVSKFDGKNWTTYTKIDGLADKWVTSIAIDAQNNKWFGTGGEGVSKFDDMHWTTYTIANGLASNSICSIAVDKQSNIWFGTYGGGVSKFDGTNWITYNTTNSGLSHNWEFPETDNTILSIAIDSLDNKWFGTLDAGVSKFDGNNWTNYNYNLQILKSIAIDAQNNKWFGCANRISKLDNMNQWTYYTSSNSGFVGSGVNAIAIDAKGNKWFGSDYYWTEGGYVGAGVSKFDGTNWTNYNSKNGLVNDSIHSIAIDQQDNKWFGTEGGVSKLQD
jgi:ligand-binding sensor domain-containing protein